MEDNSTSDALIASLMVCIYLCINMGEYSTTVHHMSCVISEQNMF